MVNKAPSQRLILRPLPVKINKNNSPAAMILTIRSVMLPAGASIGRMVAETPNTRNVLKIFEPTTLPMAISAFPLRAAMTEVASSGKDVPIETIVRPMIRSVIPID